MKKLALISALVMAIGAGMAMAQDSGAVKKQTVCPVMGGPVNTNLYVDYDGKRIYACCAGCLPDLRKNPAKYVSKLEKSGVTLAKAEPKEK